MSSVEKIVQSVFSAIPAQIGEDLRTNIEAVIRSRLESLNLVSREEFEIQQKILERTRTRLDALQERLAVLEKEVKSRK